MLSNYRAWKPILTMSLCFFPSQICIQISVKHGVFLHGAQYFLSPNFALITSQKYSTLFHFSTFPIIRFRIKPPGSNRLNSPHLYHIIIQSSLQLQLAGHMICDVVLLCMHILCISLIEYCWMSSLCIYLRSPQYITGVRSRLMIERFRPTNQL